MDEEPTGATRLIDAAALIARLRDPRLRIIDARFELAEPQLGRKMYESGHVPGAVHLDLDRDLASPAQRGKGRHPLPDMARLASRLGDLGIDRQTAVVVYDQTGTMYAARAWWLLRYAGHEAVRFLDGGLEAYLAAGGTLTSELPEHQPTTFDLMIRDDMVVTADELGSRLGDPGYTILDARAPERYRGEVEPLDDQAGHIPTALNRPYTASSEGGRLLSAEQLAERHGVGELTGAAEVVAYCGSGVSAAHLVLALEEAGLEGVKLYPGSWSEWSTRPGVGIATGPEPGSPDA